MTANNIGKILDIVKKYLPSTKTIVAQIINRKFLFQPVDEINRLIEQVVLTKHAMGHNVSIVDMQHALIYPQEMFDARHPNKYGYPKMASKWAQAILGAR